jgi:hypothetical protein
MAADKSNVIDMTARRKAQLTNREDMAKGSKESASVQDITQMRQEILTQERRRNRRTILTNFIGAFIVIPEVGLQPVILYDVSNDGISFDTEFDAGRFKMGEEYAVRVYLSRDTYFPFVVTVKNVRELKSEGVFRHGTTFQKHGSHEEALRSFIKFVETISTVLRKDSGDHIISQNHRG